VWPIDRWSFLWASTLTSEMCFIRVADWSMVPFKGPRVSSVWLIDRWSPWRVHVFHPCGRSTDGPLYGSTCVSFVWPIDRWSPLWVHMCFIRVANRSMVCSVYKPSQSCSMDQWVARCRWSDGPYSRTTKSKKE